MANNVKRSLKGHALEFLRFLARKHYTADTQGYINISLTDIAKQCGIPHGSSSRVLKFITENNLLEVKKELIPGTRNGGGYKAKFKLTQDTWSYLRLYKKQ